jgi:hypothetical protein
MKQRANSRRADLVDRARIERNAFVAGTARQLAGLPRARDAARLFRTLRRISRFVLRTAE